VFGCVAKFKMRLRGLRTRVTWIILTNYNVA